MNVFLQVNEAIGLLSRNDLTVMGILAVVVFLLIWHTVRQENKYNDLLKKTWQDAESDKQVLIDIATKSIIANERTIDAIQNMKDVLFSNKS